MRGSTVREESGEETPITANFNGSLCSLAYYRDYWRHVERRKTHRMTEKNRFLLWVSIFLRMYVHVNRRENLPIRHLSDSCYRAIHQMSCWPAAPASRHVQGQPYVNHRPARLQRLPATPAGQAGCFKPSEPTFRSNRFLFKATISSMIVRN